jgi:hypothetical protein
MCCGYVVDDMFYEEARCEDVWRGLKIMLHRGNTKII